MTSVRNAKGGWRKETNIVHYDAIRQLSRKKQMNILLHRASADNRKLTEWME